MKNNNKKARIIQPPTSSVNHDDDALDDADDDADGGGGSIRRYDLKGYERAFTISKEGCCGIAHALKVTGPVELMIQHMIPAFRMVLNRHPKMRALLMSSKSNDDDDDDDDDDDEPLMMMTSYIQPPFTSNEVDTQKVESLVTIIRQQPAASDVQDAITDDDGDEEDDEEEVIRKSIQDVCNETVDRTTQYPFFLRIHVMSNHHQHLIPPTQTTSGKLTIILFSDHTFSDGYSGMIILNDLLINIRLLIIMRLSSSSSSSPCADDDAACSDDSREPHQHKHEHDDDNIIIKAQLKAQSQQLPLRPSLYDQFMGCRRRPTLVQRLLINLVNMVGKRTMQIEARRIRPILPSRDDLMDVSCLPFPVNKSYCLMDSGSKNNLECALEACHREKVTLHGAIVACVLMAHVKAKYPDLMMNGPKSNTTNISNIHHKFKINMEVTYNMRGRVKSPFPELTVGLNSDGAYISPFDCNGVDLSRRFWDVARYSKTLTDKSVSSFSNYTERIFCHYNFHAANNNNTNKWNLPTIPKGVIKDVDLSNLGRYPFPLVHDLGGVMTTMMMRVEGLHFYCSTPNVGYNALLFIVSTEQLHYAMNNRMSDEDGARVFRYMVQSIEAISTIGENETMWQACERILTEG